MPVLCLAQSSVEVTEVKCQVMSSPFNLWLRARPGSVVVECSPAMREVGGSILSRVKHKTLKLEVLLLCLALSTKELETV